MPANILNGDRFAERGGTAWWGGSDKRLEETDGKATTAVKVAGIDFPVTTVPLYGLINGAQFSSGHVAIIRPTIEGETGSGPVVLGVASEAYTPINNYRVAELIDPLTATWPTETVGALGKGEDFFVTLNAGRAEIAGDEMQQYFFVWNKHDGTGALRIMFTPVRVVCQNTCLLGARRANVTTSVIHTHAVDAEAQFAIDLTLRLQRAQQSAMEELAQFAQIRVTDEDIRRLLYACYPDRQRDARADNIIQQAESGAVTLDAEQLGKLYNKQLSVEAQRERAAKQRLAALQEYQRLCEERPSFAATAWLLYQSITAMESHRGTGSDAAKGLNIMTGGTRGKIVSTAYENLAALAVANR